MANSESRPLGQQALRAFGIFHVITALPAMVILGFYAWEELMWPYAGFYHFFAASITAFMAAGIVFIVYVQRKAVATSLQTLLFEGAKSTLATGLWLWLILDSAYGPSRMHDDPEVVRRKVQRDAFASIVLLVVFYPPLGYAWVVAKSKRNHDDVGRANDGGEEAAEPTERAPLLSQEGGRTLGR